MSVKSNMSRATSSLELLAHRKTPDPSTLLESMNEGDEGEIEMTEAGDHTSSLLHETSEQLDSGSTENLEHALTYQNRPLHVSHTNKGKKHKLLHPSNLHGDPQDESFELVEDDLVDIIIPTRRVLSAIPEADSVYDSDAEQNIDTPSPSTPNPVHAPNQSNATLMNTTTSPNSPQHATPSPNTPLHGTPSPISPYHMPECKEDEPDLVASDLGDGEMETEMETEDDPYNLVEAAGLEYLADRNRHRRKSKIFRSSLVRSLSSMSCTTFPPAYLHPIYLICSLQVVLFYLGFIPS